MAFSIKMGLDLVLWDIPAVFRDLGYENIHKKGYKQDISNVLSKPI